MALADWTDTTKDDLYRFFAIAFDAAPGVTYMTQLYDAVVVGNMTVPKIVEVFTTKKQFTDIYPAFISNQKFATDLVEAVMGAAATDAVKKEASDDIVAALQTGMTRGAVIYQGFKNFAAGGDAAWTAKYGNVAKLLENQVAFAKHYTETLKKGAEAAPDMAALKAAIAGATATSDVSTPEAIDAVMNPPKAVTFTLTSGVDKFVGGAGADTVIVGVDTSVDVDGGGGEALDPGPNVIGSADDIDGGAGVDTLNWYAAEGVNNQQVDTYKNIEVINISGSDFIGSNVTQQWLDDKEAAEDALDAAEDAEASAQEALDEIAALAVALGEDVPVIGEFDPHVFSGEGDDDEVAGDQAAIYNNMQSLIATAPVGEEIQGIMQAALDSVQQYATNNTDGADQDGAYFDDVVEAISIALEREAESRADALADAEAAVAEAQAEIDALDAAVEAAEIDAEGFAGSTSISIDGIATSIINLDEQTVTMTSDGDVLNSLQYNDDVTEANLVLEGAFGQVGVRGNDLATLNLSGTVTEDETIELFDGAADVEEGDDDTVTALNVTLAGDSDGEAIRADLDGMDLVDSINASGSTANIDWSDDYVKTFVGSQGDDIDVDSAAEADDDGYVSSINTGTGDDEVNVDLIAEGFDDVVINVDTGAGDDYIEIQLDHDTELTTNVNAGAGDDRVEMERESEFRPGVRRELVDLDNFDGGAGNDTFSVNNRPEVSSGTYVRFNALANFENLEFQNDVEVDASEISGFDTLMFDGEAVVSNADEDQTIVTDGGGVDYFIQGAGTVTVDFQSGNDINFDAVSADLTVNAAAAAGDVTAVLGATSEFAIPADDVDGSVLENATITLASAYDADDEVSHVASVDIYADNMGEDFTELTIEGAGYAVVFNDEGGTLTTVDASGLTSWMEGDEEAMSDFVYWGGQTQESITVSDGAVDEIHAYSRVEDTDLSGMDTIDGLKFTPNADGDGLGDDTDRLFLLNFDQTDGDDEFVVFEFDTAPRSLQAALNTVAASTDNNVVFAFEGNTYVYQEVFFGNDDDGDFEASDAVVKLVGSYELDDLATALTLINDPGI